jgi:secreted trypsin-like serine protease
VPKIIRLGRASVDISDANDPEPAEDVNVKKVHLHPKYSSRKKYNDIALLELEHAVTDFRRTMRPACLYTKGTSFDKTQVLEITGWGRTNATTQEKSSWLLKAEVHEVPLTECRETYSTFPLTQLPDNLVQSQLCATNQKDGKVLDACQGVRKFDEYSKLDYKTNLFRTLAGLFH